MRFVNFIFLHFRTLNFWRFFFQNVLLKFALIEYILLENKVFAILILTTLNLIKQKLLFKMEFSCWFLHFFFSFLNIFCFYYFHFIFYIFQFLVSLLNFWFITVFVLKLNFCNFFKFQLRALFNNLLQLILKIILYLILL